MESVNLLTKIDSKLVIILGEILLITSIITISKTLARQIVESCQSILTCPYNTLFPNLLKNRRFYSPKSKT